MFGDNNDISIEPSDAPQVDGFTILPTLLHPKSRGQVMLRSNDPKAAPVIQPNFLQEKEDLKAYLLLFNDPDFLVNPAFASPF